MGNLWDLEAAFEEQPQQMEFETFEDGAYPVVGISKIFSRDDKDLPIFKPSKLDNRMQAQVRLMVEGGKEGPPWSATASDLVVLASCLGVRPSRIMPVEETTSFLERVYNELGTASKKAVNAVVKKGWVSYFKGAFAPPVGEYYFKIAGIRSVDGTEPLTFKHVDAYHADLVTIDFELAADSGHSGPEPSPYRGFRIAVPFIQPFDGVDEDHQPKPVRFLQEDGTPDPTKSGWPLAVLRFRRLIAHFAPTAPGKVDWSEYQWKGLTTSEFGVDEAENPMVVVAARVKELGLVVKGKLDFTNPKSGVGRPKIDLMEFVHEEDVPEIEPQAQQSVELYELVTLLDRMAGYPVFEPTPKDAKSMVLELTSKGKGYCRTHVKPVWDELGIPHGATYQFADLTAEDAKRLYDALKGDEPDVDGGF